MVDNSNVTFKATYFGNLPLMYSICNPILDNVGFPQHIHRHYELLHVYEGSMEIKISEKTFILEKGDIVFFDSCESHYGKPKSKETGYDVLQIKKEFLQSFQNENQDIKDFLSSKIKIYPVFKDEVLSESIANIAKHFNENENKDTLFLWGKTFEIISLLISKHSNKNVKEDFEKDLLKVLAYLDNHFTEKIEISTIANKFGYELSYFSQKFKKITGISPIKYLNKLRIKKSEFLLKNTDFSIEIVSQECGFESANYFSRCFKKRFDMSPVRYRKECKSSNDSK